MLGQLLRNLRKSRKIWPLNSQLDDNVLGADTPSFLLAHSCLRVYSRLSLQCFVFCLLVLSFSKYQKSQPECSVDNDLYLKTPRLSLNFVLRLLWSALRAQSAAR